MKAKLDRADGGEKCLVHRDSPKPDAPAPCGNAGCIRIVRILGGMSSRIQGRPLAFGLSDAKQCRAHCQSRGQVATVRVHMTPAAFKTKWAKFSGKESAAYAEHFNDLCRMLGVPTPVEADPTGSDTFCFQKHVAKDAELFDFDTAGQAAPAKHESGFADVWKKECFGWEYKGPGEDLEKAYKQLLRYRESLLNPPLLIVSDFSRFIIRTNFNGTVQETHEFTNADIDRRDPHPPRRAHRPGGTAPARHNGGSHRKARAADRRHRPVAARARSRRAGFASRPGSAWSPSPSPSPSCSRARPRRPAGPHQPGR